MSETKLNFRLRVARTLGIVEVITTSAGGDSAGTTFIAEEMADKEPLLVGDEWAYRVSDGTTRKVVNYQKTETMAVVSRAYASTIASAEVMHLYKRFSPNEIDEALRRALIESYPYIASVIVDTSITMSDDTFEETIPSTILDLERMLGGIVQVEVDTSLATYPYVDMVKWTTREQASAAGEGLTLLIHPSEHLSGRKLRLIGLGAVTYPASEAATLPLPEMSLQLLALMTISKLYEQAVSIPTGDVGHGGGMMGTYQQAFDAKKDAWAVLLDPTRMLDANSGAQVNLPFAFHADPS